MVENKRHEINFKELIVNGEPSDETLRGYERQGYILIHQGPAALLHPRAMPNDTILVFALPIGEKAYELYYGGNNCNSAPGLH